MEILLLLKKNLNHKENVIIKNLSKKGFNITCRSILEDINLESYRLIFYEICFSNYGLEGNKCFEYNGIFQIIKVILSFYQDMNDRLIILFNLFYGLDVLIFSSGPSSKLYDKTLIKKMEDKIIICSVKYIIELLKGDGIEVDVSFFSEWGMIFEELITKYNVSNMLTLGIYMYTDKVNLLDFNFRVGSVCHKNVYLNIQKYHNFDILKIRPNKTKIIDNKICFNCAHSMMEVVIPFFELSGCKDIYTYGWDGPDKNGMYMHSDNSIGTFNNEWNEFKFIDDIKKMMKYEDINLYKCSIKSPIDLKFRDLNLYKNKNTNAVKNLNKKLIDYNYPKLIEYNNLKLTDYDNKN